MRQVEIFRSSEFSKPSRALCGVFSIQAVPTNELEMSYVPEFTFEVLGYFQFTILFFSRISDRILGLPHQKFF